MALPSGARLLKTCALFTADGYGKLLSVCRKKNKNKSAGFYRHLIALTK
jgi:hypothetical protein